MKLSARNVFSGKVVSITKGAVNAEVVLGLSGNVQIVAVITNAAVDNLGLAVGKDACAIVKASSVIVASDLGGAKISARNIFAGKVCKVVEGPVSTEVDIEIAAGTTVSAVITHESSKNLGFAPGTVATAIIKASNVIIGVN